MKDDKFGISLHITLDTGLGHRIVYDITIVLHRLPPCPFPWFPLPLPSRPRPSEHNCSVSSTRVWFVRAGWYSPTALSLYTRRGTAPYGLILCRNGNKPIHFSIFPRSSVIWPKSEPAQRSRHEPRTPSMASASTERQLRLRLQPVCITRLRYFFPRTRPLPERLFRRELQPICRELARERTLSVSFKARSVCEVFMSNTTGGKLRCTRPTFVNLP